MRTRKFIVFCSIVLILLISSCGGKTATPVSEQVEIIFAADSTEVQAGECTILHWEVSGGFQVTIDEQPVDKAGEMEVCPETTRVYKMAVDAGTHVERRDVELVVSGTSSGGETGANVPGVPAYQADAWVALGGPPGDLGYDIRYNFDDHDTWYVTDGSGGFFISNDRGLSWLASNTGIASLEGTMARPVFSATVDPHNPQTIWIGTRMVGHIYKSTDGGETWVQMDHGITNNEGQHFRGFTVDPRTSDTVYAMAEVNCSVLGWECVESTLGTVGGRVYRTTDGGQNWEIIWEGEALARYLWINPEDPQVMYLSTGIWDRYPANITEITPEGVWDSGVGILKTIDGGETWTTLGMENGLDILHVGSLYMHPENPEILLAGTGHLGGGTVEIDSRVVGGYGGVFLTTDGGRTWNEVVEDETIGAVEFCAQDPSIAYAGGSLAFYRSEDGGNTWQRFGDPDRATWGPEGIWVGIPIDIQTDPEDCNRVFINNYTGGNFLSSDGGKTWTIATVGYSGAMVRSIQIDPQDSAHIYAAVRMGLFVSQDAGNTWEGISNYTTSRFPSAMSLDPSNASHLLATFSGGIPGDAFETEDGGSGWASLLRFPMPAGMVEGLDWYSMAFLDFTFAPSDPSIVYAPVTNVPEGGAESTVPADYIKGLGVYRSDDGGSNWEPASDASTAAEGFGRLAVNPVDAQVVLVGSEFGGGIFKTIDGGQTWQPSNTGLPVPYPDFYAIIYAPSDPQIVLASGSSGLFRSQDGGDSWTQLTAGLDPFSGVKSLAIDPTDSKVMYVATPFLGAYYSTDGGETFQQLVQGLATDEGRLPVTCLVLSSDGQVLYAGTEGLGVWRLGTPVP